MLCADKDGVRKFDHIYTKPWGEILNRKTELEEITHTGGKVNFNIKIDADGRIAYNVGLTHSRPTPAALFAVYAIPQGVAVHDIKMGGIGTPWNPPPLPDCFPVFISSDSTLSLIPL